MTQERDLIIIGGGPAGLCAAINGSSEGLRVALIDSGPELGGQASKSSLVENYPGFPEGVSGADLTSRCVEQATKFGTDILCPVTAATLRAEGKYRIVTTDDYQEYAAETVIVSVGLSYRRLSVPNIGAFMGRGILYGAPTTNPLALGKGTVCIVGGANSAGQAAVHLSRSPDLNVKILVRKQLQIQMSQYLLDRIRNIPNIEVVEGVEVKEVSGTHHLEGVIVSDTAGNRKDILAQHLFIFIGAAPKTHWLNGSVAMDEKKFIMSGTRLMTDHWKDQARPPLPFETSMPGVFACGDVRLGSTKRISSAVGEGAVALQSCHDYRRHLGL